MTICTRRTVFLFFLAVKHFQQFDQTLKERELPVPSIRLLPLVGEAGGWSLGLILRVRGGVHPGQVVSQPFTLALNSQIII